MSIFGRIALFLFKTIQSTLASVTIFFKPEREHPFSFFLEHYSVILKNLKNSVHATLIFFAEICVVFVKLERDFLTLFIL